MVSASFLCRLLLLAVVGALDLTTDSPEVQEEGAFAVSELSALSDSGVYTTLSLSSIMAARAEEGLYHNNVIMTLELSSPHFASGRPKEIFQVVVMTHKEDKIKSIAIDEFPVMNESAIESFYEKRVDNKERDREESFRRLEIEAITRARLGLESSFDDDLSRVNEMVDSASVKSHMDDLDTQDLKQQRLRDSKAIQAQLPKKYAEEETALQSMTLGQLYEVSNGEIQASSFQKSRAKDVLDSFLQRLV